MTVSVDLTVAKRSKTLTLPSESVRDAASPAPWVFVVEDGRLVRRPIGLGIRGDGAMEVVSGLAEGAEVALGGKAPLSVGQRVRPDRN